MTESFLGRIGRNSYGHRLEGKKRVFFGDGVTHSSERNLFVNETVYNPNLWGRHEEKEKATFNIDRVGDGYGNV